MKGPQDLLLRVRHAQHLWASLPARPLAPTALAPMRLFDGARRHQEWGSVEVTLRSSTRLSDVAVPPFHRSGLACHLRPGALTAQYRFVTESTGQPACIEMRTCVAVLTATLTRTMMVIFRADATSASPCASA